MKSVKNICLLFLSIGMISSCLRPTAKVNLALRLTPGDTFLQQEQQFVIIEQEIFGMKSVSSQKLIMESSQKLLEIDKDNYQHLQVTFSAVRGFKHDPANGYQEFDTFLPMDPYADLTAKVYYAMMGKSIVFVITPKGEVKEISGLSELMNGVVQTVLDNNEIQTSAVLASLSNTFSAEAMEGLFKNAYDMYPSHGVSIGESWKKKSTVENIAPMILDTKYTLTAVKNGVAIIQINSLVSSLPEGKPLQIGGMEISYDITGTQTGEMQVDVNTGWVLLTVLRQDIKGTIGMKGESFKSKLSWPVEIVTYNTNRLLQKDSQETP